MNILFDVCVDLLQTWATIFGISYEALNVLLFCVIWPLITLVLIVIVVVQKQEINWLYANFVNNDPDK